MNILKHAQSKKILSSLFTRGLGGVAGLLMNRELKIFLL
jgi:hypothetical protein